MTHSNRESSLSRRAFFASAGASALAVAAAAGSGGAFAAVLDAAPLPGTRRHAFKTYPVGLELFSVRRELTRDLPATLSAVSKMGYQVVESMRHISGGRSRTRRTSAPSSTISGYAASRPTIRRPRC